MPTVEITLSDDLRAKAQLRASELGFPDLEAYIASLLTSDIELPISEQLEAELLESLRSPARQFIAADWNEKRQRLIEQHRRAKAG